MADLRLPDRVLLVVAAFSRHDEALLWAQGKLVDRYGAIALLSPPYAFNQTEYYAASMGTHLKKRFLVFQELAEPDCLPDAKLHSNALEQHLAESGRFPEARPLNLDPGILSLGKFQLATTKDQAHRIYIRDGIFAEVTLRFEAGAFVPNLWTYADYRQPLVLGFLKQARDFYRQRLHEAARKEAGNG